MHTTRIIKTTLATIALGAFAAATAGPLSPPAGPVAPTMKTLHEVEPRIAIGPDTTPGDANNVYIIIEAGSYYLTENLVGEGGKNGVRIAAANVTFDLNGFEINGNGVGLSGIVDVGNHNKVRNGSIVDWTEYGVDASNRAYNTYEDLKINACGEVGLSIGSFATVSRCNISAIHGDNPYGIIASTNASVTDSSIIGVNGIAMFLNYSAYVARNSVFNCEDGIRADLGCLIEDNVVTAMNNGTGIRTSSFSTIRNNVVRDCNNGIIFSQRCFVTGNLVQNCDFDGIRPISPTAGAMIADNTVGGCGVGIIANYTQSVVVRNTAVFNSTNYDIGGSQHGPIVADAGLITNENPHANFSR